MSKFNLNESEKDAIREMYGYSHYKTKDRLEGVKRVKIDTLEELIYYYSSRKFYEALNNLVGYDTNTKYGPKNEFFKLLDNHYIIMTQDDKGNIDLDLIQRDGE